MGNKSLTHRMCLDGMLGALYVVLIMFSIRLGSLRITIASLPIVFCALSVGTVDAVLVAMLGEFLMQVMQYGITATTALWILPPVLRALTIGIVAYVYRKKHKNLDQSLVVYFIVIVLAAMLTTAANTGVMILDALIFDYSFKYVFTEAGIRFLTSLISSVVVALICLPLLRSLRKGNFIQDFSKTL